MWIRDQHGDLRSLMRGADITRGALLSYLVFLSGPSVDDEVPLAECETAADAAALMDAIALELSRGKPVVDVRALLAGIVRVRVAKATKAEEQALIEGEPATARTGGRPKNRPRREQDG